MKKWKEKLPMLGIALVLGLVAFIGLLWLERQSLNDFEKETVVICEKSCAAGELITEKNVNEFFSVREVPVELATGTTYGSLQEVVGFYPERTISPGEIIYTVMLQEDNPTENLNRPVELSVTAEIDFAVAGRIRKGDVVNVYVRDSRSDTYELILEQVVVQRAYDAAASVISNNNDSALASMFTFCVEADVMEQLGQLYIGEVAVVKIR